MYAKEKKGFWDYLSIILIAAMLALFLFWINPYRYVWYALLLGLALKFLFFKQPKPRSPRRFIRQLAIITALAYLCLWSLLTLSPFLQVKEFAWSHPGWKQVKADVSGPQLSWKRGHRNTFAHAAADLDYYYVVDGLRYQGHQAEAVKVYEPFWITEARKLAMMQEALRDLRAAIDNEEPVVFCAEGQAANSRFFFSSKLFRPSGSFWYSIGWVLLLLLPVIIVISITSRLAFPAKNKLPPPRPPLALEDFRTKEIRNINRLRWIITGIVLAINCGIMIYMTYHAYEAYQGRASVRGTFGDTAVPVLLMLQGLLTVFFLPLIILVGRRLGRFVAILRNLDAGHLQLYKDYVQLVPRLWAVAPPYIFEPTGLCLLPLLSVKYIAYDQIGEVHISRHQYSRHVPAFRMSIRTRDGRQQSFSVANYAQASFFRQTLLKMRPGIRIHENF